MNFRTELNPQSVNKKLNYNSSVLLTGSCFSENISSRLEYYKFRHLANPFGVLYNPVSLANELDFIIGNKRIEEAELFESHGLWRHPDFHSRLANPSLDIAIHQMNESIYNSNSFLKSASHIIVTFGTAVVYRLKSSGRIVGNNHKLPSSQFDKEMLTAGEIASTWKSLIQKLRRFNPQLEISFTVSPVRHIRDGLVENQLSKSVLFVALDEILRDNCYYFPSYEIVMDDLREYRFYESDLIHPNAQAVDYIFEKFTSACIDESVLPLMHEIARIQDGIAHRPIHPESEEYANFKRSMNIKIRSFQMQHPEINFDKEMTHLLS